MRKIFFKILSTAIIILFVFSLVPLEKTKAETQDYTCSFLLWNHPDGDVTYELNVSIPQSLYQYYTKQNHDLYSNMDFAKYVTPNTLKPLANKLWQIYNNTEDFTNGVLMLVHQLTYKEIIPGKYPVETLVAGYGDCDLFAYTAASILQAGGIPTVLLYYKTQQHMEIGVDLGKAPKEARVGTYSVNYQDISYYIGECTGDNWRTGWRIGETPSQYQNISSQVITLENMEQNSIGQVSADLRKLDSSTLSLKIFPPILLENENITVSGQILPQAANENVTLQTKNNSGGWTTIACVATQADGRFEFNWAPAVGGIVAIQATWVGNLQYNGAKSGQISVIILPLYMVLLIVSLVLAVAAFVLVIIKTGHRKQSTSSTQLPEIACSLAKDFCQEIVLI
jgi:hypothetical protein